MNRSARPTARVFRRSRAHVAGALSAAALLFAAPGAVALPLDPPQVGAEQQSQAEGPSPAPAGEPLEGVFGIDAGQCEDEGVTSGAYFRMVDQSGGHVQNNDSPCGDNTYTPLRPGSDGGLIAGDYQPHPDPAFGSTGGGLNDRITEPESFFGTDFSTATNPTDPQTGEDVAAPIITRDGDRLDGDLRAFAAAWNTQHFNQGSPKPEGDKPGNTDGPEGTINATTGRYTLTWSSQIEGGPFNGFTGVWHLEGTFEGELGAAAAPQAAAQAGPEQAGDSGGQTLGAGANTAADPAPAGEPTPRTGAPVAVPAGAVLLAVAALLRMVTVRPDGR